MYQFIIVKGKAFAFKDESTFRLACYVKLFPEYVQIRNNQADIYHKHHNKSYYLTLGGNNNYRLDLVTSKDATQLYAVCKHIKESF